MLDLNQHEHGKATNMHRHIIHGRPHTLVLQHRYIRTLKKSYFKIDISSTEVEEQNILHMFYCNIVWHAAGDTTNVGRLNAKKIYLCRDFCHGLFWWMARKQTNKETDNSNVPHCVAQAHSVDNVNLSSNAVSPTAITVGSTSPTVSSVVPEQHAANNNIQTPNTSILRQNLRRSPRNHSKASPCQLALRILTPTTSHQEKRNKVQQK